MGHLDRRASLSRFILAYIFALAAYYITTGVAQTQFAKQMGLPASWFAVLGAMPLVGSLMQLPSSIISSRFGRRKLIVIAMGFFDRSLWIGIAAIPWLFPAGAWRWGGLLVMLALLHLTVNIALPLQQSWTADVVPSRITGRFFGKMRQVAQIAALFLMFGLGWVLDYGEGGGADLFLKVLSGMFVVSALFGMVEVVLLSTIPDPLGKAPAVNLRIGELLSGPLKNKQFGRYLAFNCSATFANLFLTSYVTLYLIEVVKLSNSTINLALFVIPLIFTIPAYVVWGKFIDHAGIRPTLVLAMIGVAPSGLTYAMMQPDAWVGWYVAQLFVSACFCGVEVALITWLTSFARSKEGGVPGSHFIAVSSITNGLTGLLAGFAVGWLVSQIGAEWTGSFLGVPMTYHRVLMLISVGLRLATVLWLLPWTEPGSIPLHRALRGVPGFFAREILRQIVQPIHWIRRRFPRQAGGAVENAALVESSQRD